MFGAKKSKVWEEAKNIVIGIKNKKLFSKYSHSNKVDLSSGSYEVNCFGFVNHILITQKMENSLQEVQNFIDSQENIPRPLNLNPCPVDYVLFLKAITPKQYWIPIYDAKLLTPGDIIAYSSDKKYISPEQGQHIMIVADTIKSSSGSPLIWVPIFDSTKISHGLDDSRKIGNGIGQGTIGLELDDQGVPRKLQWRTNSKKKLPRTITMARVRGV